MISMHRALGWTPAPHKTECGIYLELATEEIPGQPGLYVLETTTTTATTTKNKMDFET